MLSLRKFRVLYHILMNYIVDYDVLYVIEDADWVVKSEGMNYQKYMKRNGIRLRLSITPIGARDKTIHFGSVSTWINDNGAKKIHSSNKIVLTWYHVPENDKRINYLKNLVPQISYLHTSCEISKKIFLSYEFPESKIIIVPIPVDLEVFDIDKFDKQFTRQKYQLPTDKFIIGSFQKDGNGWGEGMTPKLVKGPDLLCDALDLLEKKDQIHLLLSGPARGYVKSRLDKSGISFTHVYLKDPSDVVELYSAIDAYVISSRVEGGPKALMESWAMKVPLISTNVGMCADYGIDDVNLYFSKDHSGASISKELRQAISDLKSSSAKQMVENGFNAVKNLSYDKCSKDWLKLYKNLMTK